MIAKRWWVATVVGVSMLGVAAGAFQFRRDVKVVSSENVAVGGATIQVDFAEGAIDLGTESVVRRVNDAAHALEVYYGRFPVAKARVLIVPVADRHGVFHGTTWGGVGGFQGFTRISVGQQTTAKELAQ
jgi:hypothetical protein